MTADLVPHLKLVKSILGTTDFVEGNTNIAAQHTGALVDEQAASEMVLCHFVLLLPEVDLAHSIPALQCKIHNRDKTRLPKLMIMQQNELRTTL